MKGQGEIQIRHNKKQRRGNLVPHLERVFVDDHLLIDDLVNLFDEIIELWVGNQPCYSGEQRSLAGLQHCGQGSEEQQVLLEADDGGDIHLDCLDWLLARNLDQSRN